MTAPVPSGEVETPAVVTCPECGGTALVPGHDVDGVSTGVCCETCEGHGVIVGEVETPCATCGGTGRLCSAHERAYCPCDSLWIVCPDCDGPCGVETPARFMQSRFPKRAGEDTVELAGEVETPCATCGGTGGVGIASSWRPCPDCSGEVAPEAGMAGGPVSGPSHALPGVSEFGPSRSSIISPLSMVPIDNRNVGGVETPEAAGRPDRVNAAELRSGDVIIADVSHALHGRVEAVSLPFHGAMFVKIVGHPRPFMYDTDRSFVVHPRAAQGWTPPGTEDAK